MLGQLAFTMISNSRSIAEAVIGATPLALFLFVSVFIIVFNPRQRAKRVFETQRDHGEPITYVFNSQTVSCIGVTASWSIAWSVVWRFRETKSLFLLYRGPNLVEILPKRFFRSPGEMERWRQLVSASVDPKLIEKPSLVGRWC
jgi:hypothetical protein